MNIFYNKGSLKDTLICWFGKSELWDNIELSPNCVYFYYEKNLVGINILNISTKYKLPEGRLIYNDEIKKIIDKESNIKIDDLSSGFFVGKIISCENIINTHLSKCLVDIKTEKLIIVCGASNVVNDALVVVAKPYTFMNNGIFIKPGLLRGIESFGMICSKKELNIETENDTKGIILLKNDHNAGDIYKECYSK